MSKAPSSTPVLLGGRCNLTCTVCDCRDSAAAVGDDGVPRAVRAGGERLDLRSEAALDPAFDATLDAAREHGWREVWVRTNGQLFTTPNAIRKLRDKGVRGITVPLFSQHPVAHDRIAGKPDALVTVLRAMKLASAEGLGVAFESPVLATRLQDLGAIVDLAVRAVGKPADARFYVPRHALAPALSPPPFAQVRVALAKAYARCDEHGIDTGIRVLDGLPLCVMGHEAAHERRYHVDPNRPARARDGYAHGAPCATCAVNAQCLGPTEAYRRANGDTDLVPFTRRPAGMFDQRTTPRREWNDRQREAASEAVLRVLRPTVHCNQDCSFCSANETSENTYTKPDEMLRQISRIARQGVRLLAFGGGEPTLSKDLVHYIAAAKRLGIEAIEVVTNGVLIDSHEKVRPLREAGLTQSSVSLHAHDETLSRRMTQKVGDWEKSVRAIDALADLGVFTTINHVVNSLNYAYLPKFAEFMVTQWQGRVGVSFAFITPQFRALENMTLVPRISDVIPYLRRAMRTLSDQRIRFTVGSRQGIPVCFLGEYAGWSDALELASHAISEDAPQKVKGPQCERCAYTDHCAGVYRSYAAHYGLDELVPIAGPKLTDEQVRERAELRIPVTHWDDLPGFLQLPRQPDPPLGNAPPVRVSLPMLSKTAGQKPVAPSRTLTVALLGSGAHAQRLARSIMQVPGLNLAGVASPHLLDRDAGMFAGLVLHNDATALLDALKPDAVIVAAATIAHHPLALLAIERGLPVLVEKPFANTREQAMDLVSRAESGAFVMPAHNMAFTPGVRLVRELVHEDASWGEVTRVVATRRAAIGSVEAPTTWSRVALYQILLHAVVLLGAGAGTCAAEVLKVDAQGDDRPEWVRAELRVAGRRGPAKGEIVLDYRASASGAELVVAGAHGHALTWRREGADETLVRDTPVGDRMLSVERGSDAVGMLTAFRDAALAGKGSPVSARDGMDAMATARAIVDALASHLVRPGAPKHVASAALRG